MDVSGREGTSRDKRKDSGPLAAERRLNSWKEIAAFLGRTERTAKRWEATQGLPVRRVPSTGRGSVFAYEHELRNWLNGGNAREPAVADNPEMASGKRWPTLATWAMALVLLLAASAVFVWRYAGNSEDVGTKDSVAAELYRSGQHEWQTRTPAGLERAISNFKAAVARDGHFAKAYLGLANAYILAREFDLMPTHIAYAQAGAAVTNALKFDPELGEAHATLAFLDFYSHHDVAGAKREFAMSISLNPRDPIARHWYATFLMTIGDFQKAQEEIDTAENLDAESTAIVADKALITFYEGKPKDAARALRQIEDDQPAFASAHSYLAYIDLAEGDDQGYLRESKQFAMSRKDTQTAGLIALGAAGLQRSGRIGMLQKLLAARIEQFTRGQGSAYEIAKLYALQGDQPDALRFLEMSVARSEPETIALKIDIFLAGLRHTPEFKRLLSDTGLDG